MIMHRFRQILAPFLLGILLLVTSCASQPPSRFEQAQQESSQQRSGQAVVKDATQGSEFNKFFPKAANGYQQVFTQEKKGFAQAKLKQDGKDVATLSISDTKSTPDTAKKYEQSTKTVAGYPSATLGNSQTSILVNNRYQVTVRSTDPSFNREAWLQKFDLKGLSRLQ